LDETLQVEDFLPSSVSKAVASLQGLIAESEKCARRYLRKFVSHERMQQIPLVCLNEHTKEVAPLLAPLLKGEVWGLISDAGLPCIADPGSDLVALAHLHGIPVETFPGPSSILMALQLSGFSGQRFSFHGYLPKEPEAKIRELEALQGVTHLWIEAPYRSEKMLQTLKQVLHPKTWVCVAASLTLPQQRVMSQPIAKWRDSSWGLAKESAIFLLSS
jgi:16S rRNA (cytidine1402-2'-O)-methyltransferase